MNVYPGTAWKWIPVCYLHIQTFSLYILFCHPACNQYSAAQSTVISTFHHLIIYLWISILSSLVTQTSAALFLSFPPSYILTRLQLCCLVHRTDPLHPVRITQWIFRSLYIEIYSFSRAALRIRQGMRFVSGYSCLQLQMCLNGQRGHTRRLVAALYDPIHCKVSVTLRWFCTGRIFHLPALETFCFGPGEGRIPYHSQHCT